MMKAFCAATAMTIAGSSMTTTAAESAPATHRYLIERTFPAGALDGVDAAVKKKVNDNNATLNVTWEKSYANADKTKTYCVYDGPSEAAVREAAKLNGLPVDNVTAIPADIKAEPRGAVQRIAAGNQRYLVKRSGSPNVQAGSDQKFGVTLLTSYATADQRDSFWVYEAPSFSAVESAAKASGTPFESIAEIPETLYPR
ncbi:MAG TPA: nickel-binding protein [Steroidobacteraceae bacterium]|nr:nickel-binding protein [Steroidobacteraceae bacterium]